MGLLERLLDVQASAQQRCAACSAHLPSPRALVGHLVRKHFRGSPFPCVHMACNEQMLTVRQLHEHLRRHAGEDHHTCERCERSFSSASSLRRHALAHDRLRLSKCSRCDQHFAILSDLYEHEQAAHGRDRSFSCELCERAFETAAPLRSHLRRVHAGEWPFRCALCSRTFTRTVDLHRHQRLHALDPETASDTTPDAATNPDLGVSSTSKVGSAPVTGTPSAADTASGQCSSCSLEPLNLTAGTSQLSSWSSRKPSIDCPQEVVQTSEPRAEFTEPSMASDRESTLGLGQEQMSSLVTDTQQQTPEEPPESEVSDQSTSFVAVDPESVPTSCPATCPELVDASCPESVDASCPGSVDVSTSGSASCSDLVTHPAEPLEAMDTTDLDSPPQLESALQAHNISGAAFDSAPVLVPEAAPEQRELRTQSLRAFRIQRAAGRCTKPAPAAPLDAEAVWRCAECDALFASAKSLNEHLMDHLHRLWGRRGRPPTRRLQ